MSQPNLNEVEAVLVSDVTDKSIQQNKAKSPKSMQNRFGSTSMLWLNATLNIQKICAIVVFVVPGGLHLIFGFIAQLHKFQTHSIKLWKSYDYFFKFIKIIIAIVLFATYQEYDTAIKFYWIVVGAEMLLYFANVISKCFNKTKKESGEEDD